MVKGKLGPLNVYPAPVAVAWVTVTLAPPVLVMTRDLLCVLPTCRLPKLKLVGVAVSCPNVVSELPTPATRMAAVSFFLVPCTSCTACCSSRSKLETGATRDAVACAETFPLRVPPALGAKTTLKFNP